MYFVDVGSRHFVQLIHKRLHVHLQLKTPKSVPLQNVIVVGHAHGLEEACLVVWVTPRGNNMMSQIHEQ